MIAVNVSKKKSVKLLGKLLFVFFLIIYVYATLKANTDLIGGDYVLFMDERITFDEVGRILSSKNISNFFDNITYKGDHRYGKILYNVSSFFSFIPRNEWGESGQIVAVRLTLAFFLLTSYIIFCITFFRTWIVRALAFILILSLPSTDYFLAMPKPEPIQLFFLSLFFYFAVKKQFGFGKHWLFIGLAFGAKISTFPIIVICGIVALYNEFLPFTLFKKKIYKSIATLFYLIFGFFIAEPMILFGEFNSYMDSTWNNTAHGSDKASTSIGDWLVFLNGSSSDIHLLIYIMGLVLLLVISIFFIRKLFFKVSDESSLILFQKNEYALLLIGILTMLIYMVNVDRLWGFYLHIPQLFICIGVIFALEVFLKKFLKPRYFVTSLFIISPLLLYFLSVPVYGSMIDLNKFANRTKAQTHITKQAELKYLRNLITTVATKLKERPKIYYDPEFYQLKTNNSYEIKQSWGFFKKWNENYEVVTLYRKKLEDLPNSKILKTNVRYEQIQDAIKALESYTITEDEANLIDNNDKYVKLSDIDMPDVISVYLRADVYKKYINKN